MKKRLFISAFMLSVVLSSCTAPGEPNPYAVQQQSKTDNQNTSDTRQVTMASNQIWLVYRKSDGLYFTVLPDGTPKHLGQSDNKSDLLTVSPDGQLFCYTSGENKVHIFNMETNQVETFEYPLSLRSRSTPYAKFVQGGKGLVFLPGGFFLPGPAKIPQRHFDRVGTQQPNLFYYALGKASSLSAIDRMGVIAEPRFDDDHVYYAPITVLDQAIFSSDIVSYDVATGVREVIAHSKDTIDSMALSGRSQGIGSSLSLLYITVSIDDNNEFASYRIYSKTPPETGREFSMVETPPTDILKANARLVASPSYTHMVAIISGETNQLLMINPKLDQSVSLNIEQLKDLVKGVIEADFSPDGSKLFVIGKRPDGNSLWYAVLDVNNNLVLGPADYTIGSGAITMWLNDNTHYCDYSPFSISVMDTTTGKGQTLVERSNITANEFKPIGSLEGGKSLLYLMDKTLYSINLSSLHPSKLITDVENAWIYTP